ncbi:MarR family winged helix-turn-helix transcriptional regulator [Methanobrevibacter sp.]
MEKHNIPTVPYVSIIYREHAKFLNDKLKDEDLSYGLYPLLINIYQYEGIIQEELAKIFHLNESTITRNLKKLEDKGFIERTSNKRTKIIKTTPKGKHTAQKIMDYDMQWDNKIIEIIGQKEYLNLKDNLKMICDSMV